MSSPKKALGALFLWSLPLAVSAQDYVPGAPIVVDTSVHTTVPQIGAGIVNLLLFWSTLVTTAVFLLGALLTVGSGGGNLLDQGKKMMTASLIGYAIIVGSWLILSTVISLIQG